MVYRIQLSMECWWQLLGAALVDGQLGMPSEIPPPRILLIKKDY